MNDTPAGQAGKKNLAVFAIVERDRRTFWIRVGNAWTNRDGSITLSLDAVPIGTNKLQIREPRFEDGARGDPAGPAANGARRNGASRAEPALDAAEAQP